jgi:Skp family chaperone for outer membrane proteins
MMLAAPVLAAPPEIHLLGFDRKALIERYADPAANPERERARIEETLAPIFDAIAAQHGGNVLVDKALVLAGEDGIDVTKEIADAADPVLKPATGALPVPATTLAPGPVIVLGKNQPASEMLAAMRASVALDRDGLGAAPKTPGPVLRFLVVDRAALVRQSKAGQSIETQARDLVQTAERQFKRREDALRAHPDPARDARLKADLQARKAQLDKGLVKARRRIEQSVGPLLERMAKHQGADIVFDRATIASAPPDADITSEAVAALDRRLPRVTLRLLR